MKNTLLIAIAGLLLVSCGNDSSETKLDMTEPANPQATDPALWSGIASPVISFGSIDCRYAASLPFTGTVSEEINLRGWKGESLSAQIVVSAPEPLSGLECIAGDFKSERHTMRNVSRARFVKYVLSDDFLPESPCGLRPENAPAHIEPDLLDNASSIDMPAMSTRPVWLTVNIPGYAEAGGYRSDVTVKAGGVEKKLRINLEVIDRTLPEPYEWEYHLDLWQHPSSVARAENLELWSDEHFERMRPTMQLLADAGQKVITATLNKDPWNHQCYDAYEDMIVWTKNQDGSWSYDYSVFDRWVEFMMNLGIRKYINCYSMAPWNDMLHYTDAASGETVDVQATPGTPEFYGMWTPFLKDFVSHLKTKGWLEITNIAMDERSPQVMDATVALLEEAAPELGIALADNHKSYKKYPQIEDICTDISGHISQEDIDARRAEGKTSTFYVCCSTYFPNTYTSSDPAEATYLSWYGAANDYDGFLRWAYNSWTEDPIRDSRFRTWTAGDTYIVYPGGLSSIRFERLREGVQDWEKLHILRKEFIAAGNVDKVRELDELLLPFRNPEKVSNWNDLLNEAKARLNRL